MAETNASDKVVEEQEVTAEQPAQADIRDTKREVEEGCPIALGHRDSEELEKKFETESCDIKPSVVDGDQQDKSQDEKLSLEKEKNEEAEEIKEDQDEVKDGDEVGKVSEEPEPVAIGDNVVPPQTTTTTETIEEEAETQEVSSTKNDQHHHQHRGEQHGHQPPPKSMRLSSRRASYQGSRGYVGGYQNYGLTYLPYKSNFEPSEDARRRADEFFKTLKL